MWIGSDGNGEDDWKPYHDKAVYVHGIPRDWGYNNREHGLGEVTAHVESILKS